MNAENADENFSTTQILNTNAANKRMTRIFSIFIRKICSFVSFALKTADGSQ